MTCILSNHARFFRIRVPGKDIDFRPTGRNVSGILMHL